MRTLRRYLWNEIALATLFVLFALLALFLFFDMVQQLDEVGRRGFLLRVRRNGKGGERRAGRQRPEPPCVVSDRRQAGDAGRPDLRGKLSGRTCARPKEASFPFRHHPRYVSVRLPPDRQDIPNPTPCTTSPVQKRRFAADA